MRSSLYLVVASLICFTSANLWDDLVDSFKDRHLIKGDDVVAHVSVWTKALSGSELAKKKCDAQLRVHRFTCTKVPDFKQHGKYIERYRIAAEWDAHWDAPRSPLGHCALVLFESEKCKLSATGDRSYSMGNFSSIAWGATWGVWNKKKHRRENVEHFVSPDKGFLELPTEVEIYPKSMKVLCYPTKDWEYDGWMTEKEIQEWSDEELALFLRGGIGDNRVIKPNLDPHIGERDTKEIHYSKGS